MKVMDMKKLGRFLSYVLVAALATVATLIVNVDETPKPIQKLAQLEQILSEKFIGEADTTQMADAAADAMVASLGDRWSYYIPADEYSDYLERMSNSYVGIGITISPLEDGTGIEVIQVAAGGPCGGSGGSGGRCADQSGRGGYHRTDHGCGEGHGGWG